MEFDEHQEQPPPEVRKNGAGDGDGIRYRYKECLKNHALGIGGHALDGCGEFIAAGDDGSLDGFKCAACNCHRNFHRKEVEGKQLQHHWLQHLHVAAPPSYHHHHDRAAGYLHLTPAACSHHQRQRLALPSTSREDLEEISNPSSSGGGNGSGSKKRFRTKFTAEQKDRMVALSEALGWRIQKDDDAAVVKFCAETGVKRHVLKVWMHNNKYTIGKKP